MNEPDIREDTTLSVVMPAYNEEANIVEAVNEVQSKVLAIVPGSQFVVIDDGSKDKTGELLDKMAESDNRLVIMHKTNSGHGPSLIAGMNAASGRYIFLIDSDMQIPLDCFPALWEKAQQCDGVFGTRTKRQDPWVRIVLSQIIRAAVQPLFGTHATDLNSPCKLFRREIWQNFRSEISADDILAPSLMLNIFARRHGYAIEEVPVAHRPRLKGESVLKLDRLMRFCWSGLRQLVHYRNKLI
jgi:dolichol-phosphate mannosyltransferase